MQSEKGKVKNAEPVVPVLHFAFFLFHFALPQCLGWESNPHCPRRGGCFTDSLAAHRASEGDTRTRGSSTGGSRTHTPQGLSLVAMPFAYRAVTIQSPRWESNPRDRHTKTVGSRYNTGAFTAERPAGVEPTHPPWQGGRQPLHHGRGSIAQSIRRGSHPRRHFGRVACCCYTTDAFATVEAVGVEPTSSRLRGGCLAGVGHTSSGISDCRFVIDDWRRSALAQSSIGIIN